MSDHHKPITVLNLEQADLTFVLLNPTFANSVDPDQLASKEADWSGFALFAIKYVNLYQPSGSGNLIGWKLEVGMAS